MDVVIHRGNLGSVRCETINQLISYIGCDLSWHFNKVTNPEDFDICLCPVDLKQTAIKNGYLQTQSKPDGDFDPFTYHWYSTEGL